MDVSQALQRVWLSRGRVACLLLPLAAGFALLARLRRFAYRWGCFRSERLPVPVIVVGNITVGGSGKTPLTLYLAQALAQAGWHPGIVSRGYSGRIHATQPSKPVCEVLWDSSPALVGDEPLLLRRRTGVPVFVGADRVQAGRALLAAHPTCNVILCDDGLQHYRLARDVELAVFDQRGVMNGWPLPAGPLREPVSRLRQLDAIVLNSCVTHSVAMPPAVPVFQMCLQGERFYRLDAPELDCAVAELRSLRLAAVVGIGAPERFFAHLRQLGLSFEEYAFPDHHQFCAADLATIPADALLMTEKDAVKCAGLSPRPVWVLPVSAQIEALDSAVSFIRHIEHCLLEKRHGCPTA